MVFCEKCEQQIVGKFVFNQDKPELKDKKFCSKVCMEQYYNEIKSPMGGGGGGSSSSNFNWKDYQGWIIGGVIVLVLLIILGMVFSGKKKRR